MIKNLERYVQLNKGFLSNEICDKTINELKNLKDFEEHKFYDVHNQKYHTRSGSQELDVSWDIDKKISTKVEIEKKLMNAAINYQKFLLPDITTFQNGFQGYAPIRFNRYNENKKMAFHSDHIHSLFDGIRKGIPILSMLGVLNDDFEGGEFILFDNYKVDFKKGDLLIFPSIFLFPHRVEPVTKGTRYSYISWLW